MSEYVIKAGKTSSGINFNPLVGHIIEGSAVLQDSCVYSTEGLTPRESTSINKIIGFADLFNFNTRSARLGFRMSLTGERIFELCTYLHNGELYNVSKYPAEHITFVEPEQEFYFRIQDLDYQYKFTVNDKTISVPKIHKKLTLPVQLYPFFEIGDKKAPHDMHIIINKK